MSVLTSFLEAVRASVSLRPRVAPESPTVSGAERVSPGRHGPEATVEVDPKRVGRVSMSYSPSTDGNPDPGEIVWTWVPYEERDGRGKDRPVLIVATERNGALLAAQLTSKSHDGESDYVLIGAGKWDSEGRTSWVNLDRIFRVHPSGMRREAASLDSKRFQVVARALHARYGWTERAVGSVGADG